MKQCVERLAKITAAAAAEAKRGWAVHRAEEGLLEWALDSGI